MKAVILVLGLLAAVKIGVAEYLFRAATRDVIVAAYKERAVDACRRDAGKDGKGAAGAVAQWSKAADIRLVIGKSELDVYPWQIDHHLWHARYRNPYLLLSAATSGGALVCEYDVVHNAALIHRM
jgi:hypothetical protein